ncbi:MAG: intradiol ring-cleavage dioxygenase [Proteobacteria bacterium]|nr:intradiol ring-cleavage dioxygenase [Pseudomonadota bacterium]
MPDLLALAPDHDHDHHGGLARDVGALLQRRRALLWLAGSAALPLVGCGGGGSSDDGTSTSSGTSSSGSTTTSSGSTGSSAACSVIPEETNGPYPADGSNSNASGTVDVLTLAGIVRSDVRPNIPASLGDAATGVPLTVTLTLVNASASCAGLEGYAIYLWHCDSAGRYSLYSDGVTDLNYLRGVQVTDANGQVSFTTIFPACYSGRMPHIHYEIYRSANSATAATNALRTAQIALPNDICNAVYATTAYSKSAVNFAKISFTTDNVFSDNVADGTLASETCAITGSVTAGYAATLTVGIAA